MRLFDCHFHIESGIEQYNITSVSRNVIFNFIDNYAKYRNTIVVTDAVSLIFEFRNNLAYIKDQLQNKRIQALKIHSRIQQIGENDYNSLNEALESIMPITVPVIIDAFYYGADIEFQPILKQIVFLCRKFKDVRFIIAHSGGYEVLKYFYHLKNLENVYFDLSFSLAYLKNTSVFMDFKNLVRYGSSRRLLFGTDYPFIDAKKQLDIFMEICAEIKLSEENRDNILYLNSNKIFFNGNDPI
jgi:predicted TIM-barrel fold metal-dependent hydrolase